MDTENTVADLVQDADLAKNNKNEVVAPSKEELVKRVNELLSNGRRAIRVNDIEEATDLLSQATELSNELYGEGHENTFDAHYFYGMAALELAKIESQLLQNPQKKESDKSGDGAADNEEKQEDDEAGDESDKEEGEESGEEDDDSMRLAWEVLETARCIAAAKIEGLEAERSGISQIEEWNVKLSDVFVLLGEHGISDGKYDQAQEDLDRALEIQMNCLPADSRKIAQTYILKANACSNSMNFKEAVTFYEKTKECLLRRQEVIKNQLANTDDKEKQDELKDELNELEETIPGVDAMIADSSLSAEQVDETTKAIKEQFSGIKTILSQLPQSSDANDKETNDISSMVRRPVKRSTINEGDTEDIKKSKESDTN